VLASFDDHDGFDGVIFGTPHAPYHFEFTVERASREPIPPPPHDDLIVLYIPDEAEWHAAVARMERAGFAARPSNNPYWDVRGRTFEDPEGRRVVLQNAAWPH
jgi:hypothetical protein